MGKTLMSHTAKAVPTHLLSQRLRVSQDALSHYVAPAQNFVYANVNGDIGYRMPGDGARVDCVECGTVRHCLYLCNMLT